MDIPQNTIITYAEFQRCECRNYGLSGWIEYCKRVFLDIMLHKHLLSYLWNESKFTKTKYKSNYFGTVSFVIGRTMLLEEIKFQSFSTLDINIWVIIFNRGNEKFEQISRYIIEIRYLPINLNQLLYIHYLTTVSKFKTKSMYIFVILYV